MDQYHVGLQGVDGLVHPQQALAGDGGEGLPGGHDVQIPVRLEEKTSSTLSSISRCWAGDAADGFQVLTPRQLLDQGGHLDGLRRVPNTLMMRSFSMAYSFPSPGASGGVPSVFSPPLALGLAPSAGWWLWG